MNVVVGSDERLTCILLDGAANDEAAVSEILKRILPKAGIPDIRFGWEVYKRPFTDPVTGATTHTIVLLGETEDFLKEKVRVKNISADYIEDWKRKANTEKWHFHYKQVNADRFVFVYYESFKIG